MARKHTLGLALPELNVVEKIAPWLQFSPSWLFFGEEPITPEPESSTSIQLETELLKYILLKYILQKSIVVFPPTDEFDKIINYIVGVIYDVVFCNLAK
jgi:hypothetical protein